MSFTPRLSQPSNTDVLWIKYGYGNGVNPCILGYPSYGYGNVLANCVGYAYGRAWEILGTDPHLCINQASAWYTYNDGYPRSSTPSLGAIACWDDGASGHVAVIEEITYSGGTPVSCTVSESVYGGAFFQTATITAASGWYRFTGYTFQGFIILPVGSDMDSNLLAAYIKKDRKKKVILT